MPRFSFEVVTVKKQILALLPVLAITIAPALADVEISNVMPSKPADGWYVAAIEPTSNTQLPSDVSTFQRPQVLPLIQPAETMAPDPQIVPAGVVIRRDEIVKAPNTAIPPTLPVIKALVESRTAVKGTYLLRKDGPLTKGTMVGAKKTTYIYLLENGQHLETDYPIENVRDLRNWVTQHPKQARLIAFADRWWKRAQPILVPVAIIVQALI